MHAGCVASTDTARRASFWFFLSSQPAFMIRLFLAYDNPSTFLSSHLPYELTTNVLPPSPNAFSPAHHSAASRRVPLFLRTWLEIPLRVIIYIFAHIVLLLPGHPHCWINYLALQMTSTWFGRKRNETAKFSNGTVEILYSFLDAYEASYLVLDF
jgi:hypothetical protein